MIVELTREFRFEAAHRLPRVPEGHKCARLHGHSFAVEVTVRGEVDPAMGWLVDYDDIRAAWEPIHAVLDHNYLNEVPGLENPTSENLARWIWERLRGEVPNLACVLVQETCNARCAYGGL